MSELVNLGARAIWKYSLDKSKDEYSFDMPIGARIVHVETQIFDNLLTPYIPTMWAIVDPSYKTEKRRFKVVATGEKFELKVAAGMIGIPAMYVGTCQFPNGLVWHILEIFE